jgi:hypothetical protein
MLFRVTSNVIGRRIRRSQSLASDLLIFRFQIVQPRFSTSSGTQSQSTTTSENTLNSSSSSSSSSNSDSSSSASSSSTSPPPSSSAAWYYRVVEDAKDVFSVAFGVERRRNANLDYDFGVRKYPWVCYADPNKDGQIVYRNIETGLATEIKPLDFDIRATSTSYLVLNQDATGVSVVNENLNKSAWERSFETLQSSPLAQTVKAASVVVAASPVGQAAGKVAERVRSATDKYVQQWESSQHPLVVSSSYVVDNLLTETEQGKAVKEMKLLDRDFDEDGFLQEMKETFIPTLVRAFFRYDEPLLKKMCRETALAQCKSHQAARESANLWRHDGVILNVSRVELIKAQTLEAGLPILVVSAQVQYIHTVRNKKVSITREMY